MSTKTIRTGLPILFSLAFLGIGLLIACTSQTGGAAGSSSSTSGTGTSAMSGGMAGSSMSTTTSNGPRAAALLSYSIVGADEGSVGPDGNKHDTFVAIDPKPIKAGQPVTITIKNADEMPHSMTSPELGLNIVVPAAKDGKAGTVDFTFTPTKSGTYRWYCAIPCDGDTHGWAMTPGSKGIGQEGFMAGTITVL